MQKAHNLLLNGRQRDSTDPQLIFLSLCLTPSTMVISNASTVTTMTSCRYIFLLFVVLVTLGVVQAEVNTDETAADATNSEAELKVVASIPIKLGDDEKPILATATVYEGEDAGIGAFRFAEEHSGLIDDSQMSKAVLDVAQQLHDKLSAEDYKPPKDISHCGKKPCSAGKLWKRAEEMRKADMHDSAGADLIRALLKTGIEVDFRERCERTLQWAFGSIQRQRQREKREAEEEAKLEKRRQEEQQAMEEAMVS